jgi:hypothetical protein
MYIIGGNNMDESIEFGTGYVPGGIQGGTEEYIYIYIDLQYIDTCMSLFTCIHTHIYIYI